MPSYSSDPRHTDFYEGRSRARQRVVQLAYEKYYRSRFNAGRFSASWIPNPEKFAVIYKNETAEDDATKCHLVTINASYPAATHGAQWNAMDAQNIISFYVDVIKKVSNCRNLMGTIANITIEHRGTAAFINGIHVHFYYKNSCGTAKSEVMRRIIAAMDKLRRDRCLPLEYSKQSVDVKIRPQSSCESYTNKKKDCDTIWGMGPLGPLDTDDFEDNLDVLMQTIGHQWLVLQQERSLMTQGDLNGPIIRSIETDAVPETQEVCEALLSQEDPLSPPSPICLR